MQYFGRYSLLILFMVIGIFLGLCAMYWRRHGREIQEQDKTTFVPITRTTQVAMEAIAIEETEQNGMR